MQLTIDRYVSKLDMDKIDVAETNVRTSGQTKGLDDLKNSIKEFGLFQPVTVFVKGNRFKLLVGQRRFLACKELGWDTIPAFVVKPLSEKNQTIVSFGENVHRRKLPYEDSIQVCNKLYEEYAGTKKDKIKKIAKDLGISEGLVTKYLAHVLVPQPVRKMVDDGKLTETFAYNLTSTYFPNTDKIISIANKALKMTSSESKRILDIGKKNPNAGIDEVLNYAKNPPPQIKWIIHVDSDTNKKIVDAAKGKKLSVESFIIDAIEKSLEEE